MGDRHFTDGVGTISVIGGAVRLDFFTFSTAEKDANGQPKAVVDHGMVMTVPAFLQIAVKIREAADAISRMATAPVAPAAIASESDAGAKPAKPPFP